MIVAVGVVKKIYKIIWLLVYLILLVGTILTYIKLFKQFTKIEKNWSVEGLTSLKFSFFLLIKNQVSFVYGLFAVTKFYFILLVIIKICFPTDKIYHQNNCSVNCHNK